MYFFSLLFWKNIMGLQIYTCIWEGSPHTLFLSANTSELLRTSEDQCQGWLFLETTFWISGLRISWLVTRVSIIFFFSFFLFYFLFFLLREDFVSSKRGKHWRILNYLAEDLRSENHCSITSDWSWTSVRLLDMVRSDWIVDIFWKSR